MTEKINILFDSKIFIEALFTATTNRSGIYFVAWNILQIMQKNINFNITFTYPSEYENLPYLKKIKKIPFFLQYKFINVELDTTEITIKQKIEKHKKNMNFIKMIYNYLRLIKFKKNNKNIYKINKKIIDNTKIYISPYFVIPQSILKQEHIKKFYILYDAIPIIFPESASPNHTEIVNSFNKDIYSFCISQSCKDDFLKYCGDKLDANKMFVTYIATNQHYIPKYDKQELLKTLKKYGIKHNPNDKYLFSLCNFEPRKNLIFTITCFLKFIIKHNINDLYFYLGGNIYKQFKTTFAKTLEKADKFKHKIKLLGYLDDADTNILYSNSLFFTFLSQYEGFGMPPLEAMQSGTPVITSNNSSLPEVVGDAAIMIDYDDEEQCIKSFEDLYFNEDLRKHYIEKGLERAKLFTWEKTVDKMTEVITKTTSNN
jgi:glycosyltransferase involved in cell wall biosynthesis